MVKKIAVFLVCLGLAGCSTKQVGYTTVGAAAGAGIGYSYHHDNKDAALGGLAGGVTGAIAAQVQENTENKKYKTGYEKGYSQAQVDIAVEDWKSNTGKCAHECTTKHKKLTQFKVPQREQDNVVYEFHYVTLEDYR